jgi:lactoylglutathione lyase
MFYAPRVRLGYVILDVADAFRRTLREGARTVAGPAEKPWGQTVAYVRDPDGILVELCSETA